MASTIGKQLAQKREGEGISVEEVSHRTRIPIRLVRCLENDDYSGFPNLVYARSFLRMYCAHLGIDGAADLEGMREPAPARSARAEPLYFRSQVTRSEVGAMGEASRRIGRFPWRTALSALFFAAVLGAGSHMLYGLWKENRFGLAGGAPSAERKAGASEEDLIGRNENDKPSPAVTAPENPAGTPDGEGGGEEVVLRAVPVEPRPAPAPDATASGDGGDGDGEPTAGDAPPIPADGPGVTANGPAEEETDEVAAARTSRSTGSAPPGAPPREAGSSVTRNAN